MAVGGGVPSLRLVVLVDRLLPRLDHPVPLTTAVLLMLLRRPGHVPPALAPRDRIEVPVVSQRVLAILDLFLAPLEHDGVFLQCVGGVEALVVCVWPPVPRPVMVNLRHVESGFS